MINNVKNMRVTLLEFSVENFKVFKERATFSLYSRKSEHTFENNGENLLRASLIYGPNASGKSSLFDAFAMTKTMIQTSANLSESGDNKKLPYFPFRASNESQGKPTFFEVVFSLSGKNDGIYRYNFSFLQDRIISENLIRVSGNDEVLLERGTNTLVKSSFSGQELMDNVRDDALALSTFAQLNNEFALDIIAAFRTITVTSGVYSPSLELTIQKIKDNPGFKEKMLQILRMADFCISGMSTREVDTQGIDFKFGNDGKVAFRQMKGKNDILSLEHPIYGTAKNEAGTFQLDLPQESAGTQKFLASMGPVISALESGGVLFIDEFDNSLHPLLTKFIIDQFESEEINNTNAQLVVTTHDTSLLSYKDEFIKDQFWFTEKDAYGAGRLFSLAEFELRNDTEYGKKYLEGRFGALPFVGSVKK